MLPAAPLPPATVTEIRFRYLTEESLTIAQLAKDYQHPAHRIASLLKGKDWENFRTMVQQTLKQAAVDRLTAAAESAAIAWTKAIPVAQARGDHRPMKDLLIATKAIDAATQAVPQVVVQIGISAADVSISTSTASAGQTPVGIIDVQADTPADQSAPQPAHVNSPSD